MCDGQRDDSNHCFHAPHAGPALIAAPPGGPDLTEGGPYTTPDPPGARSGDRPPGPIVVEFAGTPRAGKTSAMHSLMRLLQHRHRIVHLVEERAQLSPVPSSEHPRFNLWTATTTTSLIIQAMYSEADVVLVDRGLFDSLCWLDWYRNSKRLSHQDADVIDRFLCVAPLRHLTNLVLVMTVDPVVAVRRERATWQQGSPKGTGPIINAGTLTELNDSIAATVSRHSDKFTLQQIDTTHMNPSETVHTIARVVWTVMNTATQSSVHRRT